MAGGGLAIPEAATTIAAELNGHTIGEATVERHSPAPSGWGFLLVAP
jgi:hypothetical protein